MINRPKYVKEPSVCEAVKVLSRTAATRRKEGKKEGKKASRYLVTTEFCELQ
jgi:hypothetical protein